MQKEQITIQIALLRLQGVIQKDKEDQLRNEIFV